MPQNDPFKRYLDAGIAFTQLSREKAEEFVKDLVKQGDVRRKEAEDVIEALVERSRKNTEDLVTLIRQEIAEQLRNVGLEDLVKKAGLPVRGSVADAAEKVDDAAKEAARAVAPKKSSAKKAAAKKPAVPSPGSRLVVPGAPKKATAKKLVVAKSAASGTKKAATKKATAAKKSTKKS